MFKMKVKLNRLTNKHNKSILKDLEKYTDKVRLNKVLQQFDDLELDTLLEDFIDLNQPTEYELDTIEQLIRSMKMTYENGVSVTSDKLYDKTLCKYKKYRDEEVSAPLIVSRLEHGVKHDYPLLRGTLDKANFIYEKDNDTNTLVSVETYINKWKKCLEPGEILQVRISKKYDGSSGTMSVNSKNKVDSVVSRGEEDNGSDLTHLFKDLKFKNGLNEDVGIQVEIIMTKEDFEKYCEDKGRNYSNLRSAVVSILTSSNTKYSKYLSFVPLFIEKDNVLYDCNEYLDIYSINGLIKEQVDIDLYDTDELEQLEYIINDIYTMRDNLNYAIDGVVISALNESVIKKMGRKKSINQFQVAYKFPPLEAYADVKDVTVNVGRTGLVTPMIHYTKVYFNGTKHNKSSISSFKRFKKMELRCGDKIKLTYNNDVMPYPVKLDCEDNDNNTNELIEFPKICPFCNKQFKLDGANYFCMNSNCPSKRSLQLTHFLKKLKIKNVSIKSVETFLDNKIITDYISLFNIDYNNLLNIEGFGESKVNNLKSQLEQLLDTNIEESKLCDALSICGEETAAKILSVYPLQTIMKNPKILYDTKIPQIEYLTKESFIKGITENEKYIIKLYDILNIVPVVNKEFSSYIIISGFRDSKFEELVNSYDIGITKSLKKAKILVVKENSTESSTVDKVKKQNKIPIITKQEYIERLKNIKL